jgi:large subunit GTPase 1
MLGPDGMPLADLGMGIKQTGRNNAKKHFKTKEGKKRSGKGYD